MFDFPFRRARTVLFALLAYSPAFLTFRLIGRYGVDLPVADDWNLMPTLIKAHQHSLTFFDFFSQNNEHRYVFPRLMLLVIGPLSSGNMKALMFCSLILAVLASGGMWYLLGRTTQLSLDKRLLLLGLVNLFLFGPVQVGNWTWGGQFVLFLSNLFLVTGVAVAISRRSLSAKFVICLVIALVATFSFGSGAVLWVIIFPVALLFETRVRVMQRYWWLAGWFFAGALAMKAYFFHYVRAPIPHAAAFDYLFYISIFFGNHLSKAAPIYSIAWAATIGITLMVFYLGGALWTILSRDASFRRKMLPWLAIGAFTFISAALAAATRIGMGVNQSLETRYTTFSLYLTLSIIGMFAVIATNTQSDPDVNSRVTTSLRWLTAGSLTLLLAGHVYASVWGIDLFDKIQKQRLHAKAAVFFTNVLDSQPAHDAYICVDQGQVREKANSLDRLGFIHPPLVHTPELSKLASRPQQAGFFESVSLEGQVCKAVGWAMIPKGYRPADAVLLAYDDPTRGPIAFALTVPTGPRPEVVQATHDDRVGLSGWSYEFERSKIPAGDHRITAWAFDADKTLLYPLINTQMIH